jgi:hypothetical protein
VLDATSAARKYTDAMDFVKYLPIEMCRSLRESDS